MLNLSSMSHFSPSCEQGGGGHGGKHIAVPSDPTIAVTGLVGFGGVAALRLAVRIPLVARLKKMWWP